MPIQDFTINATTWKSLPEDLKAIVNRTWREFSQSQVSRIAENDKRVSAELRSKGVELVAWSAEDIARTRVLAQTWQARGCQRPLAKQAVESQRAFLRDLKLLA